MENKELTQHEKDIYNLSGHIFEISGHMAILEFEMVNKTLSEARDLVEKLTKEIENKEGKEFKVEQRRYQDAFQYLISPESAVLTPLQKLKDAFQIAAFGKVMDYKPEEHPEEDEEDKWLRNLNFGGKK